MSIIKNLSGISTIYTNNIYPTGVVDSSSDISGNSIVGIPILYFNGFLINKHKNPVKFCIFVQLVPRKIATELLIYENHWSH